jgi:hypothetical protein
MYCAKVAKWSSLRHSKVIFVFGLADGLNLEVEFCENGCVRDVSYDLTPRHGLRSETLLSI